MYDVTQFHPATDKQQISYKQRKIYLMLYQWGEYKIFFEDISDIVQLLHLIVREKINLF